MPAIKKEYITFILGAGLSAAGLTSIPASEAFLTAGSALISLSYGILLFDWRRGTTPPSGGPSIPPPAPPSATPQPKPFTAPTPPTTPSVPSAATTGATSPAAPPLRPPTPEAPAAPTPSAPTPSPQLPAPGAAQPEPPAYAAPSPPSAPSVEQPKPPGRKLPSLKAPKIQLPQPVIENRVPIALLAVGLVLVVIAVAITFGSAAAFFWGVFIPGILLLGFGGGLLFLRLYRQPGPVVVEVRRFCMHCGFQMSSGDVSCPRCHRQPPSGVDTKVCPNCGAVIPTLAKFCRDCGAGQPTTG